ncbi:hypothetical protein WMY93_014503 [Mugilogobius chulae]|uniref:Uncharacterized protein n=1 Tax=Mugilogobius chulae TaxID=88201 RepID=A0AAW0NVJ1_9GOBI
MRTKLQVIGMPLPPTDKRVVRERVETKQKKMKAYTDLQRHAKSSNFRPGDKVRYSVLYAVFHPMIPQDFFYTDPTMMSRIPNHINEMRDFECFQLNTPPPIMSARVAPPIRPDPFRTGHHLSRRLGCSSWEMGPKPLSVNHMWLVIELTQEEDQTITNLLKLHHGGDSFGEKKHVQDRFSFAPDSRQFSHSRAAGKHWSEAELEVANTLLTHFGATSDDCEVKRLSDDRGLSMSEEEALCGLLNLGLVQI